MSVLRAAFGPSQSLSDPQSFLLRAMSGGRSIGGVNVSEYTALNVSAVYAAVGIIADTIGQLPLHLYRRTDKGRVAVKRNEHPVAAMLQDQANPYMTPFTLRQTSQSHALLWGNGYMEIQKDGRGRTVGLWPLIPENTWPSWNDRAQLVYRTNIDKQPAELDHRNVAHVRALGHDGYVGHSQISLHRQSIGLAMAAERYGAKFYENEAMSGGFLYHPGKLDAKASENLRKSFSKQGGLDNAHRIKILEEGMKFERTTIPPDDAQFLGTREFQLAEIARIYRVPLILMQSHEGGTTWGTGIEQILIGFVVWTLQAWVVQWEQELNRKLFTKEELAQGYFVRFALNALLRGDMTSRANFYKAMREISTLSANEIRELEDLNTNPELGGYTRPANWVPVNAPAGSVSGGTPTGVNPA
ncbi:phage portal protein [Flagellatimonas centrodinii]|uniref:phage portal protein n=1 Tax=Flagellatimonas centrodinii TaxID=2806210 RepID=UPI001FEE0CCD|nr:phage portal protein [Flagellatimonas centrodinii]ULQ45862.1 phage portal protein [Flagellatimonas centrodinii]